MTGDPLGAATKGVIDTTKKVIVDGVEGVTSTAGNTVQTALNVDTGPDHNPFLHASKVAGAVIGGTADTAGKMAGSALSGIGQTAMNVGTEALTATPGQTPLARGPVPRGRTNQVF